MSRPVWLVVLGLGSYATSELVTQHLVADLFEKIAIALVALLGVFLWLVVVESILNQLQRSAQMQTQSQDTFNEEPSHIYGPEFWQWCMQNENTLANYPNSHLAISPTFGVVAASEDHEEFKRLVHALGSDVFTDVTITHASMLRSNELTLPH
jgi:ABC-type nickel/cobalt efflux system permease component RcnA